MGIGQPQREHTRTHVSRELLMTRCASLQRDWFALAVTLLELIGAWNMNAHGYTYPDAEAVTAAAMAVKHTELKELVLRLMTGTK